MVGLGTTETCLAQSVPDSWLFWPARLSVKLGGNMPQSITSADFNGDGYLDIATANYGSSNVSVVLATEAGLFGLPVDYSTGPNPVSIVSADFNRDGYSDLATANYASGYAAMMSVLLGTGTGSFGIHNNYICQGENPTSIVSADFNEDTYPDIAVAVQYGSGDLGNVSVYLNAGDGTFGTPTPYYFSGRPFALTSADFNEDNHADLAVARISGNIMSVMIGTGTGEFDDPVNYTFTAPSAITSTDVNDDGHVDVAGTNDATSNRVTVKLGTGSGSFSGGSDYPVGWAPQSLSTADFNQDNYLDIVVGNINDKSYSVLLGSGGGTFGATVDYHVEGSSISAVHTRDLSGDDVPDLVAANEQHRSLGVLLGLGTGVFADVPSYSTINPPRSIASGDFNEDGYPDLVVGQTYALEVFLGSAAGDFTSAGPMPTPGQHQASITCNDFNEDGHTDLAVANYSDTVTIFLGTGTGGFSPGTEYPTGGDNPETVVSSDFNEDGHQDLAVSNGQSRTIGVLLGAGDGTFASPTSYEVGIPGIAWPYGLTAQDFNSDDHMDLAVGNASGNGDSIWVLLGTGSGVFASIQDYCAQGNAPLGIASGDFNEDGYFDLVTGNFSSSSISILLGNEEGSFNSVANNYIIGSGAYSIAVTDLNGDGHLDLAMACYETYQVMVYLGTGSGTFSYQATYGTRGRPMQLAVSDFNTDGKSDAAASDWTPQEEEGTGYISIFFGRMGSLTPPQPIHDLTITPAGGGIQMRWSPVEQDTSGQPITVSYYRIWRSLSSTDPEVLYDSTDVTFYEDPEPVGVHTARFYNVTAVR